MDTIMKAFVWPIMFGLAIAFGVQLGANIALSNVSPVTPELVVWILKLLRSGLCYLLFPAIAVWLNIARPRG